MKRSDIESNGVKRKATEPPPFRNVTPESGQIELDPPNDGFFSNSLIRFLIINLLLVAILLAANIFVVLGAKTVQTTEATPGIAGANTTSAVVNPQNQAKVEASQELTTDDTEPNAHIVRNSASKPAGEMKVVRFAKLEKIPTESASEYQPDENTERLSKAITNPSAIETTGNRLREEAETNLFSKLATLRERVNAQHEKAFGNPPPSSDVCELGTCTDPSQTNVPIGAPYYGTKIKWNRVVKDAVTQAKSEDKLVFLIHVSGNFAKEEFTWNNAQKFRAGALSDLEVADFIAGKCVATFQQAGDFLVTPVNGKMIKNGGNVVSYFCTPEGRLIHAVGGPVDAERLLEEARWAVDVFDKVQSARTSHKATVLRDAHQFAANNAGSIQHVGMTGRQQLSFQQTRVHRLLAKYAYLPMSQLETTLFQALSGEHFETDRAVVFEAASAFANAEKRNRPVLLILGPQLRGHRNGASLANYNARQPGTIDDQFNNRQVKRHLRRFSVIHIPKNQLAAFTNLVELTGWDTIETSARNWRTSHTCLLVNHSGEILLNLDIDDTDHFADQLKSAMETWKQHLKSNSDSKAF